MKKQLGIAVSQWDEFMYRMRMLAERKVQWNEAMGFFMDVLCDTSPHAPIPDVLTNKRAMEKVQSLYEGKGRGSDLESARGTAWGLLTRSPSMSTTSVELATTSTAWTPPGSAKAPSSNNERLTRYYNWWLKEPIASKGGLRLPRPHAFFQRSNPLAGGST